MELLFILQECVEFTTILLNNCRRLKAYNATRKEWLCDKVSFSDYLGCQTGTCGWWEAHRSVAHSETVAVCWPADRTGKHLQTSAGSAPGHHVLTH